MVRNLGRIAWQHAEVAQKSLVALRHAKGNASIQIEAAVKLQGLEAFQGIAAAELDRDSILICEHNPVYTGGRRISFTSEERERLHLVGATIEDSKRGGEVTFHGPGQLVAYPIFDLRARGKGAKWYVNTLEQAMIDTCNHFHVKAERTEHTGVWVGNGKIGAIGIQVSRGVTWHGVALNCNTDLSWFDHIIPCGITDKTVTSLSKETRTEVTMDKVTPVFVDCLRRLWES